MSDRARTIAGVLVLIGLVLLWAKLRASDDGAVPAAASRAADPEAEPAAKKGRAKKIEADDVPVIVRALSRPRQGETFERERSLFAYAQSPAELKRIADEQKAAADKAAADAEIRRVEQEKRDQEAAEAAKVAAAQAAIDAAERAKYIETHPPKPVPPRFELEYVGIVGPKSDAYAILRGPGQKLSYAKAGDVIDRKFRIERVAKLFLDLTYTDPQFAGEMNQVQRTIEGAAPTASPRH